MKLLTGTRIKAICRFKTGGKLMDVAGVEAEVIYLNTTRYYSSSNGVLHLSPGTYAIELPLTEPGPLRISFRSALGDRQEMRYDVVAPGESRVDDDESGSIASILRAMVKIAEPPPSPPVLEPVPEPPPAPRFDRAGARSALMRAGIVVEESWSDVKVKAAFDSLSQHQRDQAVWDR